MELSGTRMEMRGTLLVMEGGTATEKRENVWKYDENDNRNAYRKLFSKVLPLVFSLFH